MSFTTNEMAAITGAAFRGANVRVKGLSTDTREIRSGMLFCAIRGEHFDGNNFLEAAATRGAAAALAERDCSALPTLVVPDTVQAMQRITANWRQRFDIPCVAITGSNGKTTVKEMLARILSRDGQVLATAGNLNNHIGVPLTLARLDEAHTRLVLELGANHVGEIASLAQIARPLVGVITIIAPAHLEGFGSIDGVARAKGELIESLPPDGTAVVNGDGPYQQLWRHLAGSRRLIRFGFTSDVDVRVSYQPCAEGSRLRLVVAQDSEEVLLPLAGRHNAANAAAACAGAMALGENLSDIAAGLATMRPVAGRLSPRRGGRGERILDDSYNANPSSLAAALDVLCEGDGQHWLVLGDMAELGEDADAAHREAGRAARMAGVDHLWCVGRLSRLAAEAFGVGARHFDDKEQLVATLVKLLDAEATVLVKGSRSAGMESVVAALVATGVEERSACC